MINTYAVNRLVIPPSSGRRLGTGKIFSTEYMMSKIAQNTIKSIGCFFFIGVTRKLSFTNLLIYGAIRGALEPDLEEKIHKICSYEKINERAKNKDLAKIAYVALNMIVLSAIAYLGTAYMRKMPFSIYGYGESLGLSLIHI